MGSGLLSNEMTTEYENKIFIFPKKKPEETTSEWLERAREWQEEMDKHTVELLSDIDSEQGERSETGYAYVCIKKDTGQWGPVSGTKQGCIDSIQARMDEPWAILEHEFDVVRFYYRIVGD